MRFTYGDTIQRTSTKNTYEVIFTPADVRIASDNTPAYLLKSVSAGTLLVYPYNNIENDDWWVRVKKT